MKRYDLTGTSFEYKGFTSQPKYDLTDRVYFGTIENITELYVYEGESLVEAQQDFQGAVDLYLEDLKESDAQKS